MVVAKYLQLMYNISMFISVHLMTCLTINMRLIFTIIWWCNKIIHIYVLIDSIKIYTSKGFMIRELISKTIRLLVFK